MAKQLDSLLLNIGLSNNTNVPNGSVETQGEKTASSLFDNLLKQNFDQNAKLENSQETNKQQNTQTVQTTQSVQPEQTEVKSQTEVQTPNTQIAKETTNISTADELVETPKVVKTVEVNAAEQIVNENKKVSLLDKLILEAKKEVKTVNSSELKATVNSEVKTNTPNTTNVVNTQTQEVTPQIVKPINQEVVTSQNTQTVQTTQSAQPEQTEVKSQTEVQTPITEIAKETTNISTAEELVETPKVVKTVEVNAAEQIVNENKKVSLLDKLILEAKKEVKTVNSSELKATVNSEVKTNTPNTTNVVNTQTQEVTPQIVKPINQEVATTQNTQTVQTTQSVQPEQTEVKSQTEVQTPNTQIAKETTNISTADELVETPKVVKTVEVNAAEQIVNENKKVSLLDKLILEAKKEVKTVNSSELKATVNGETQNLETPEILKNIENVTTSQSVSVKDNTAVQSDIQVKVDSTKEIKTIETTNTNEKVAKELASLNLENTSDIEVNISKDELIVKENSKQSIDENKKSTSLMDQLIQKNRQLVFGNEPTVQQKQIQASEFLTSVYLSTQKNSISNQSLINKSQAISIASNATSIGDVQTSAEMLDLGLEDIDVQKAVENIKKLDLEKVDRTNLLDKLAFNKNIVNIDLKDMITSSVVASKALIEDTLTVVDDLTINANTQVIQSIQSRIIGAKQEMSQMMSDIARQMYENYKPPVTAFRVNINPATLGAITILMKNDKDNSISISMNATNISTLDALLDNQSTLRTSLNKLFDENMKFNLNFGSSNDNSSSQNSGDNPRNSQQNFRSTEEILNSQEEIRAIEEKNIDYM